MTLRLSVVALLIVFVSVAPQWSAAEEPAKPINLLRIPGVRVEETSAKPDERASLAAITDGDPGTEATVAVSEETPFEVVYGLGKSVAIEHLVVHSSSANAPRQVEILVSTVSANSGFRSVRSDPLQSSTDPQAFDFEPTGASWIMLRWTPAADAKQVVIGEVEILGQEGPPVTRYEFKQSPAKALDVLAKLKSSSLGVAISADEASMFADAADGKFDTWTFAEAALLASGISDRQQRQNYLGKLSELEKQAAAAVAGSKDSFARADRLLKMLHKTAFANGYQSQQTDVSAILDIGKYNCVSSAALYNVIGRRLGLDLRAIEVPDHAFSILYDGTRHADVETTTAGGFNPLRDEAARKQFEEKTGFHYIPDSHRDQRREVGEPGLVAIIYYNHGVELTREKQHHAALLTYFRALSLDDQFDSAVKNSLATLANWSGQLAEEKKFDDALNVLQAGLDLAPQDNTLAHNHKVIWGQWAQAEMAAGHTDQAIDVLHRAATKIPDEADHFTGLESWLFIKRGEELADAGNWREAMTAVEPGFGKLSGKPAEELRDWRNGIYIRWSNAELKTENFERAAEILQTGMQAIPDDARLSNNLVYTAQEWIASVLKKQGEDAAKQTAIKLVKQYASLPEIQEVAKNHFRRVVLSYTEGGKPDEALAAIERHQDLLELVGTADDAQEMMRAAYDTAGHKHIDQKQWAEALALYERGLKRLPNDDRLTGNLTYVVQEWLKETNAQRGEQESQKLAISLVDRVGAIGDVKEVAGNHIRRVIQQRCEQGQFEEALASIQRHSGLLDKLGEQDAAKDLLETVYERWARKFFNNDWAKAIDVYRQGLKAVPDSSLLKNNLEYCEQQAKG